MSKNLILPIETLHKLLRCDPGAGKLYWRERPLEFFEHCKHPESICASWNARYAGEEALTTADREGYLHGDILGRGYKAHRVIFAMTTGAWPEAEIDHINGDPADNRIENLRDVSHAENGRNKAMLQNNTSGVMGVGWHKLSGKWRADISVNGKSISLGLFDRIENAAQARLFAEEEHGFHENHGRNCDK